MKIRSLAFSLVAALGVASFSTAAPARADSVLDSIVPLVDSIAGGSASSPLDDLGSFAPIDTIATIGNVINYPVDPQYVVGEDGENDEEQNDDAGSYTNGPIPNGSFDNGTYDNSTYDNGTYDNGSQLNNGGENGDDQGDDSGHDD